jgi:hypothetical protein
MSMTSHPARDLPATASQGNPAGVFSMRLQACSRAFALALATRSSVRGDPASSRARRTVGTLGASPQHRGEMGEQRDVAHGRGPERDRGGQRDEHRPPVQERRSALPPQGGGQAGGEAELVGGFAEQDRAGVADQALSVRGDLQGAVPPVKLHGEERFGSWNYKVW